jgi:hypothetical protein
MNILPKNLADHEAKSPCDKNIWYPVCVPGHDSPNGTTFLTIVVYDKQKTALVDDPSDLINTRRPAVSGLVVTWVMEPLSTLENN